jgi:HD domain
VTDAIGTLAWAERTGGRLTFRERLRLLTDAVSLQMSLLPAQLRWKLGLPARDARAFDVASLRAPDTPGAKAAEAHCREVSPPYLVNHCLRAYLWGRVLATQAGRTFDDELFYVACLVHDVGLTPRYAAADPPCFAVRGATAARRLAGESGWTTARQHAVAEAIALHVNVCVGLEHGVEAHLLNAGTALDVTGLRFWELHPATTAGVLATHPRLDMKRELWGVWKQEADAHTDCRGYFLNRYLQFGSRVRSAPFAD